MALAEFAAMEAAYQALQQLDTAGRRRAVRWLNDALEVTGVLPEAESTTGAETPPVDLSASRARSRRRSGGQVAAASDRSAPARRRAAAAAQARQPRRGRQRQAGSARGQESQASRAYRRMPPAEDVMAAYRQTGTLTGLAEHFDVPRHTIQGWARRLRDQGHPIGRAT
jgi:hypothetical protein